MWGALGTNGQALNNQTLEEGYSQLSLTDPNILISSIHLSGSGGLKQDRRRRRERYQQAISDAQHAVACAPTWWKAHVRVAQCHTLCLDPEAALTLLDHAKMLAGSEADEKNIQLVCGDAERLVQGLKGCARAAPELRGRVQSVRAYMGFTRNSADHPLLPFRKLKYEMLALRLCVAVAPGQATPPRLYPNTFLYHRTHARAHIHKRTHTHTHTHTHTIVSISKTTPNGEFVYVSPNEEVERRVMEAARLEASKVLTVVLRAVCMPPLELYPADGSPDRRPPVMVHVLACVISYT